jgi:S-methylmethionine-dependent homocysteine/selenocysteine methylase
VKAKDNIERDIIITVVKTFYAKGLCEGAEIVITLTYIIDTEPFSEGVQEGVANQ